MNQKGFANITLIVVIIIVLAGAVGYFTLVKKSEPKICTEEAKVCLDGTIVGRVPPRCEFAVCSTVTQTPKISKSSQPAVTSLRLTSGRVGTRVIITGSGFTATGNKVKFGNLGSEDNPSYSLNSSDGRTLVFTVPSSDYYACWFSKGKVPPCLVPATSTQPGTYGVSVINTNGTSNEILFTVTQ